VTDTALLGVLLAGVAGVLAGRAWATALRSGRGRARPGFRISPHYSQGLHALTTGQLNLAISELTKVTREDPEAVEVWQVLAHLLRETGQVERAIQVHQRLLARADLTRAERAHVLASLAADFRKAGFLDRASETYAEVLTVEPKSVQALQGLQKLHEDQRQWRDAYEIQTRLSRLRNTDASLVLGHLQAEMGREKARAGETKEAEDAFRTALALDARVFPAHLGLADLVAVNDPRKATGILENAIAANPDRAYLAFDRLARLYAASGQPSKFVALCEHTLQRDPHDWRARLALAQHLRREGQDDEALGLALRAMEENPQVLAAHLETLRTLGALPHPHEGLKRYLAAAEHAVFYRDPHVCTSCRYRAEEMLWRCPQCHEWGTFVEERVAGGPATGY
jgi:lipopolysaccharide biosynthesis regulator YciM